MSMNLFFRAFTQQQLDEMEEDHTLIDAAVDDEKYAIDTDVETAWDVLMAILDGTGFEAGTPVDDALFNGCTLISADEVREEAERLALWTREEVAEGLRGLDADADRYHQDVWQDDEEGLLEQFDRLVAFYKEAAEKGLGAVSYAA